MTSDSRIVILVDTTATYGDVMLSRSSWMKLLSLCAKGTVRLAIPSVVLRETARHWEARASEAVEEASKRHSGLHKSRRAFEYLGLGQISPPAALPSVHVDVPAFYDRLVVKLRSLEVEILPLPKVGIAELLERDLARRKPFADSGKGFRDALIWHSVTELLLTLGPESPLYFVSNNVEDFWLDDAFHPELLAEIEPLERDFRPVRQLDEVLEAEAVKPLVAELEPTDGELEAFLRRSLEEAEVESYEEISISNLIRESVAAAAVDLAGDEIASEGTEPSSGLDFSEMDIPHELETPTVVHVEVDPASFDWDAYETYEEETMLIRAEIDAEVEIEGYVFKADYYILEGDLCLLDADWNDHYVRAAITLPARLIFQVRVEAGSGVVEHTDFEMAEPRLLADAG
jgi:hypothetical protein